MHRESIGIGLAASPTSKGPQVKITEPMVSIKVTNCSIQHVTVLPNVTWGLVQRPKSAIFSLSACGWMDEWMDVIVVFVHDFFHTVGRIEGKLKTYH